MSFSFASMYVSSYNQIDSKVPVWKTLDYWSPTGDVATFTLSGFTMGQRVMYKLLFYIKNGNANTGTFEWRFNGSAVAANYYTQITTLDNAAAFNQGNFIPYENAVLGSDDLMGEINFLVVIPGTGTRAWRPFSAEFDAVPNLIQVGWGCHWNVGTITSIVVTAVGAPAPIIDSTSWFALMEYDATGV